MKVKRIPLSRIAARDDFNVRRAARDVSWIGDSLLAHGQLEPVMLLRLPTTPVTYNVIHGFGRTAAARSIGWTHVRAFVISDMDIATQLLTNLIENRHDELHFVDVAYRLHLLHTKHGLTGSDLSKRAGFSLSHVNNAIRVADKLAPQILAIAATLTPCPVSFLIHLAAVDSHEKQIAQWEQRFGVAALSRPPRKRISAAAIRRVYLRAPEEHKPALSWLLSQFGGA